MARPGTFEPPDPVFRALRAYGLDPSLATRLDTARVSEVTIRVPWEPLTPGPIGAYLEVVDVDPASDCAYAPIDLDHPALLAQDGLAPSEGTPQFHQQMVYAVASLTIRQFERALGRKTFWRPRTVAGGNVTFVPRLRIHPHALREANAYYSPDAVALLFGYFNASEEGSGDHLPGAQVFTCLSHDIVAHETTHALLDGMYRRFLSPTNPDVLAFHEAFADIVALFQHFTFPEILRHQIASTRGQIRSLESLLGQLAGEFGRAAGRRTALRDAIGTLVDGVWVPVQPDPRLYRTTDQPHERGAILVAAVFDAFLSIYERRTADLVRLATQGTGVPGPGAIHPDLVHRLAAEAAKAAQHVLTMCIRALDYCPPVDVTFGEYLRALVTADLDLVRDDDLEYRIAFIEAFRRRGIYPREVRSLSVESLCWRSPALDETPPSARLEDSLERLRAHAQAYMYAESGGSRTEPRAKLFDLEQRVRHDLHGWLSTHLRSGAAGRRDAAFLGLDPSHPFEVHGARFAHRAGPDGNIEPQLLVSLLQQVPVPIDPADPAGGTMAFEGGCTIVADLWHRRIRYCIRKHVGSVDRLRRQQAFAARTAAATARLYFAGHPDDAGEPFAALHRGV